MKLFLTLIILMNLSPCIASSIPKLSGDITSFQLIDLSTGKIIKNQNSTIEMIPASTTKLITAGYLLDSLGPDYRFKTELLIKGVIENGTLNGDLYIRGKGDPMLLAGDLFNLALKLKNAGIKKVVGGFYYDDSFLKNIVDIAPDGDKDTTDNPGISALSSEFNRFKIYERDGKLIPSPLISSLKAKWVDNDFPTDVENVRTPGDLEEWQFSVKRQYRFPVDLPIKNPSHYTADFFRMLAKNEGIDLPSPESKECKNGIVIATHHSSPLVQLVDLNLEYSNNLLSELMLLTAVKIRTNKSVDLKSAGEELKKWLIQLTKNKKWATSQIVSGSGLDYHNKFTSELLTDYLYNMSEKRFGDKYFRSILSISGLKGWLYKRMDSPETSYRVWAKTGTLDYSGGLAGYIYTHNGNRYAFTLLTTNKSMRDKIENGTPEEIKKLEDDARSWKNRIREEHDNQIEEWIEEL